MEAEVEIKENRRLGVLEVTPDEFWDRIIKPEGCWLYDGAKEINGYGYLKNPLGEKPKYITAHRLAWILTYGPVPDGKVVMHTCDVRSCVNPQHLRLGTHEENMADMRAKKRGTYGERSSTAILTEEAVRYIRSVYWCKGKRSNAPELAKKYGCSPGAVHKAARGESWSYLK